MKKAVVLSISLAFFVQFVFAQENVYVNKDFGVSIHGPQDWHMMTGEQLRKITDMGAETITQVKSVQEVMKTTGPLVSFNKYRVGTTTQSNPTISLVTEDISKLPVSLTTALDYLSASLNTLKIVLKDLEVVEYPRAVTLNGAQGARMVIEGTMVAGYLEMRIRQEIYAFLKGSIGYVLSCVADPGNSEENRQAFDGAINSFILQ